MLSELAFPAEGQLLDVDCGTGWFTRQQAAFPNLQITGVDLDVKSLAFARSHDPRSNYLPADALALPFADASFDYVQSIAAQCFTADWRQAVSEIVRVTRRRFAIGIPDAGSDDPGNKCQTDHQHSNCNDELYRAKCDLLKKALTHKGANKCADCANGNRQHQCLSLDQLTGKHGGAIHREAHGIDDYRRNAPRRYKRFLG